MDREALHFRTEVKEEDRAFVKKIVASSGFFSEEELRIAVELVSERLSRGMESGYHFLFAELGRKTIGYTCFGRIPGAASSFDLYWIAVSDEHRGHGVGKALIRKTEELIALMEGHRIYIETSSRGLYDSTRDFYMKCGYHQEAALQHFYSPGDAKVIFVKVIRE